MSLKNKVSLSSFKGAVCIIKGNHKSGGNLKNRRKSASYEETGISS